KAAIRTPWLFAGVAWMPVVLLVAAAGIAFAAPRSQLTALRDGARQLLRSVPASAAACAAIVIGGAAFGVPGIMLLVLFATVGATDHAASLDRLAATAAHARTTWRPIAIVLALTIGTQLVIVYLSQRSGAPLPLPKKPTVTQLAAVQRSMWLALIALVITAPISAIALASIRARSARARSARASSDHSTSVQRQR
ncbi:MAG: hypothetical protein AB7L28_14035, partial [Kofleriaceae bacterium]